MAIKGSRVKHRWTRSGRRYRSLSSEALAKYWASPEGQAIKTRRRLDREAKRAMKHSADLEPRLIKGSQGERTVVRTRTPGSQYPPCKECGGKIISPQGRKRNGFCGERCRKRAFRRNADQRLALTMQNIENAGVQLKRKLEAKDLWPRKSTK